MLWHLKRLSEDPLGDSFDAFIIRAPTIASARAQCALLAASEGAETWLLPDQSSCERVKITGKPEILMSSFNAG